MTTLSFFFCLSKSILWLELGGLQCWLDTQNTSVLINSRQKKAPSSNKRQGRLEREQKTLFFERATHKKKEE